jgi:hypothetical protein
MRFRQTERLVVVLAFLLGVPGGVPAAEPGAASAWVAEWGEKWWERYHPDYQAWYPGGRTNRYHDLYVQKAMRRSADTGIADFIIRNRRYLFDGDWFVVEWVYEATQETTGLVQRESTVAFGHIVDDHLMTWVEYFDDMVGSYQWAGAMPLYDEDEEPYPWPEDVPLRREYRP